MGGTAASRNKPARRAEPPLPLRVVVEHAGARTANCVFAAEELPERAGAGTVLRDRFTHGEPLWGRCFLPDPPGANQPGDLVDVVHIDGKKAWEQAYDLPLPEDARSRLVAYGELLRPLLLALPPGEHRLAVDGTLRRGGRTVPLYHGELSYVR